MIDALGVAVLARELFPRGDIKGLEPNETQVLLALFVDPGQTVTELTGRLALAKTTVSHAVTALQRIGAVEEDQDPADRRRRPQRLTGLGRGIAKDIALLLRRRLRDG